MTDAGTQPDACTFAEHDADAFCRRFMGAVAERGQRREYEGTGITELWGLSGMLRDPRARLMTSPSHPQLFNPGLAAARWLYLFSGSDRLADITAYSPAAARFTDDGITMPGGSHGARAFAPVSGVDQVEQVVSVISRLGESTRGVIAFHHPTDLVQPTDDYICVNSMLITPRGNQLHGMLHMRSNEALRLLWYDLFEFTMLLEYVSGRLGMELGSYLHSGFVFQITADRDVQTAAVVAGESERSVPMAAMPPTSRNDRARIVELERELREAARHAPRQAFLSRVAGVAGEVHPYWADLLTAAAMQARFIAQRPADLLDDFATLGGPLTGISVEHSRRLSAG